MLYVTIAKRNFPLTFLDHKTLSTLYTSTVTIQKRYLTKLKATQMMKLKDRLLNANVQNVAICKCLMRHCSCVLQMKGKLCSLHALSANLRNLKTHNFDGNLIYVFLFRLFHCTICTTYTIFL